MIKTTNITFNISPFMVGAKDYKRYYKHVTFNISPFMVGVKDYKHYI